MSLDATLAAAEAATTDWRTYDGEVLPSFVFHVIFFPILMMVLLVLPVTMCWFCLSRGRVVPYAPPNHNGGGYDPKGQHHGYNGSVHHGAVAEKW